VISVKGYIQFCNC